MQQGESPYAETALAINTGACTKAARETPNLLAVGSIPYRPCQMYGTTLRHHGVQVLYTGLSCALCESGRTKKIYYLADPGLVKFYGSDRRHLRRG